MCLLFYRDSIVYFAALTASTVDFAVVVIFFFIILWVKFSTFQNSMPRDAQKSVDASIVFTFDVGV